MLSWYSVVGQRHRQSLHARWRRGLPAGLRNQTHPPRHHFCDRQQRCTNHRVFCRGGALAGRERPAHPAVSRHSCRLWGHGGGLGNWKPELFRSGPGAEASVRRRWRERHAVFCGRHAPRSRLQIRLRKWQDGRGHCEGHGRWRASSFREYIKK